MLFNKRKTYHKFTDDELISIYKDQPSAQIIGELYKRYGHLVMGVSMKYLKNKFDAEDVTMTLFEKLAIKIAKSDITYFKSWLYMVTKNECLMLLRKKGNLTVELTQELESKDTLEEKQQKEIQAGDLIQLAKDSAKAAKEAMAAAKAKAQAAKDEEKALAAEPIDEGVHYTYGIGDIVKNKNKSCPHYGSMGVVSKILDLPDMIGKLVTYRVTNDGPTYRAGDVLTKTGDQLTGVQYD